MIEGYSLYMEWVRTHNNIWAFERNDNPYDFTVLTLRRKHLEILDALSTVPAFIHPKSIIHESALIQGSVVIEEGAQILANAIITGPAFIGRNAVVGNFSFLRGNCFLSRDSLVGNHCYCNEATIGRSARVAHFGHFSRSIIAYNSAVSAFVLTATVKADESPIIRNQSDFSGMTKLGCVIGSNTFIASHVLLLPGVTIGHGCFIGSMSIINKDIPDNTFVEIEHNITTRPNNIHIPRREKLANFLSSNVINADRRYAGVLLIDQDKRFILQRRDSNARTYNPGKLSAFGGGLEGDETITQCAIRELYEETGLYAKEDDLKFLVEVVFIRDDDEIHLCTLYALENVSLDKMSIFEGAGFETISHEEAIMNRDLTDLCQTAILEYYKLYEKE